MFKTGAKSYAITAIDTTAKTHDTVTVGTTLGAAIPVGGVLTQVKKKAQPFRRSNTPPSLASATPTRWKHLLTPRPDRNLRAVQNRALPPISGAIKAALPTIKFI